MNWMYLNFVGIDFDFESETFLLCTIYTKTIIFIAFLETYKNLLIVKTFTDHV